jgi:hypothetical protein
MSNPIQGAGSGPDPRAEHADPPSRPAGESTRRQAGPDQDAGRYSHPEAQLGGADAVEKTTYVVGEGTEPGARPRGEYIAREAAGGQNVVAWIVGGIAALIAVVYLLGVFG